MGSGFPPLLFSLLALSISVQCESSKSLWQDLQLWTFGLWPSSAPCYDSNKMGLFSEMENGQCWVGGVYQICSVLDPSSTGGISLKSYCSAKAGPSALDVKQPPNSDFRDRVGLELLYLCTARTQALLQPP